MESLKRGPEIGKKHKGFHIWVACEICGKERWVQFANGQSTTKRCTACASIGRIASLETRARLASYHKGYYGAASSRWKGGKFKVKRTGYVMVSLLPTDFFIPMARKGSTGRYVLEHRLVVAKHLNRCLLPWEIVHHKNGVRDDNRLENLELLPTNKQHQAVTKWQSEIAKRDKRIKELEARILLLESSAGQTIAGPAGML